MIIQSFWKLYDKFKFSLFVLKLHIFKAMNPKKITYQLRTLSCPRKVIFTGLMIQINGLIIDGKPNAYAMHVGSSVLDIEGMIKEAKINGAKLVVKNVAHPVEVAHADVLVDSFDNHYIKVS